MRNSGKIAAAVGLVAVLGLGGLLLNRPSTQPEQSMVQTVGYETMAAPQSNDLTPQQPPIIYQTATLTAPPPATPAAMPVAGPVDLDDEAQIADDAAAVGMTTRDEAAQSSASVG